MAGRHANSVIRHLRRSVLLRDGGGLTDGELLTRFVEQDDEAAFEALARRHGPLVWGVCRRILGHHQDAEDAFQATFLVLARKATTVRPRDMLPNWLYGVARQTAAKARAVATRRRARERQVAAPEPAVAAADPSNDVWPLLDRELGRLPAKYRAPILLCDIEGRTHREAARQLGWPVGTVSGRLVRARALLARRLTRCGVSLSAGALAVLISEEAAAAGVPATVMASTVQAAAGPAIAGLVAAPVVALTEGVLRTMLLAKIKVVGAAILVAGAVSWGATEYPLRVTALGQAARGTADRQVPRVDSPPPAAQAKKPASAEEDLLRKLEQPVSVNFTDVPFKQALSDLQTLAGINILVNQKALAQQGMSVETRFTGQLQAVPLKTVLRYVTEKAHLVYVVRDDVVVVMSAEDARGKLFTKIRAVGDLVGTDSEKQADKLMKLIRATDAPERWAEAGGPGTLDYMPIHKSLVVNQTPDIQEQVAGFLEALSDFLKTGGDR